MDSIKRHLGGIKKEKKQTIHSSRHALAEEMAEYFNELKDYRKYLGICHAYPEDKLRRLFAEVKEESRRSDNFSPVKIFFWKIKQLDKMKNSKIKIYQKGEKILRKKSKKVPAAEIKSKKIQEIIKKMEKAILENDDALAVAAPQIGENWRITVISEWTLNPHGEKPKSEFKNMVFINPEILKTSRKKTPAPEGCLSVPGKYGTVPRAEKIKVEAYDKNGQKFTRGASGLLAQTIQHEIDHLDGILFVDKTSKLK